MTLLLAMLACGGPDGALLVKNPHAPLPLTVRLGEQVLGSDGAEEWRVDLRLSSLDRDDASLGLRASVMGPEGPHEVSVSTVERVNEPTVVLLPERYQGAGIHLCVDNRGGPAASLVAGQLELPVPADDTLLVRRVPPPTDHLPLLLGARSLGALPAATELGGRQAALVIDATGQRRYEARRQRYAAPTASGLVLPETDPQSQRWSAESLHLVDLDLGAFDAVDCLERSPEEKREPGTRLEVLELR